MLWVLLASKGRMDLMAQWGQQAPRAQPASPSQAQPAPLEWQARKGLLGKRHLELESQGPLAHQVLAQQGHRDSLAQETLMVQQVPLVLMALMAKMATQGHEAWELCKPARMWSSGQ